MTLFESKDMGFSTFQDERTRIIDIRDKFIMSCKFDNEEVAKMSEVIFHDELLKLYKHYYGKHFVNYTEIIKEHSYDIDINRYKRLRRLVNRKHREVTENLKKEMSEKEIYINDHIFQRAHLGLHILHHGLHILACYEGGLVKECIEENKV